MPRGGGGGLGGGRRGGWGSLSRPGWKERWSEEGGRDCRRVWREGVREEGREAIGWRERPLYKTKWKNIGTNMDKNKNLKMEIG